ncbi:unnamed protein product [Acanthosepion pharaonis]|uniref:Uncharacterized protein n=1 Tax=Acanthosepion pharaonis TaxID=158019 RepID=A0A812B9B7_ACAPH|nr:unnamed protein product [Sepia pharaonis]
MDLLRCYPHCHPTRWISFTLSPTDLFPHSQPRDLFSHCHPRISSTLSPAGSLSHHLGIFFTPHPRDLSPTSGIFFTPSAGSHTVSGSFSHRHQRDLFHTVTRGIFFTHRLPLDLFSLSPVFSLSPFHTVTRGISSPSAGDLFSHRHCHPSPAGSLSHFPAGYFSHCHPRDLFSHRHPRDLFHTVSRLSHRHPRISLSPAGSLSHSQPRDLFTLSPTGSLFTLSPASLSPPSPRGSFSHRHPGFFHTVTRDLFTLSPRDLFTLSHPTPIDIFHTVTRWISFTLLHGSFSPPWIAFTLGSFHTVTHWISFPCHPLDLFIRCHPSPGDLFHPLISFTPPGISSTHPMSPTPTDLFHCQPRISFSLSPTDLFHTRWISFTLSPAGSFSHCHPMGSLSPVTPRDLFFTLSPPRDLDLFHTVTHRWISFTLTHWISFHSWISFTHCHPMDLFHTLPLSPGSLSHSHPMDLDLFSHSPTDHPAADLDHRHPRDLFHTVTHWISFTLSAAGSLSHCHPRDLFHTVTHRGDLFSHPDLFHTSTLTHGISFHTVSRGIFFTLSPAGSFSHCHPLDLFLFHTVTTGYLLSPAGSFSPADLFSHCLPRDLFHTVTRWIAFTLSHIIFSHRHPSFTLHPRDLTHFTPSPAGSFHTLSPTGSFFTHWIFFHTSFPRTVTHQDLFTPSAFSHVTRPFTLSPDGSFSHCHPRISFTHPRDLTPSPAGSLFTLSPAGSLSHSQPRDLFHTVTHGISSTLSPAGSLSHCLPRDLFHTLTRGIFFTLSPAGSLSLFHTVRISFTPSPGSLFTLSPAGSFSHCHPRDLFHTVSRGIFFTLTHTHWIFFTLSPTPSPAGSFSHRVTTVTRGISFTLDLFHTVTRGSLSHSAAGSFVHTAGISFTLRDLFHPFSSFFRHPRDLHVTRRISFTPSPDKLKSHPLSLFHLFSHNAHTVTR